jgi:hypothetical protein
VPRRKFKNAKYMKKIFYLIIVFICQSCGDSISDLFHVVDNKTKYDVILYIPIGQDSILCLSNTKTVIFEREFHSVKKMSCPLPQIAEAIKVVVDGGEKHLTKDFSDINNWECIGEKSWSLVMVGSYYTTITITFVITEDDLE